MKLDQDAIIAATDLVGRTGARELNVGYLHDDVPAEEADWWAAANYRDAKVLVEHHRGPVPALEALAEKLLTGAQCQRCGGLVALSDEGARAFPGAPRPDGTVWTEEEIRSAGQCRWRRVGARWEAGCTRAPEGNDELHTTEKLAQALEELGDTSLRPLIWRARRGYYHDYLSPLATPAIQLVADLRAAGHPGFAERVKAGEFDASSAESDAWARSPDGQDTFSEFAEVPLPDRRLTGWAFWRAQRKGP